jgi:hypothetical protein
VSTVTQVVPPICNGLRTAEFPEGIHADHKPMVYRPQLFGWYCFACHHLPAHLTDYFRRSTGLDFTRIGD